MTATGHEIAQEAVNAAAHFGNTTAAANRHAQYDILSPTGLNPDDYLSNAFCAWRDYNGASTTVQGGGAVNSPYGDVAFTNMPYVMVAGMACGLNAVNASGTLDGYSIVNGHGYAETLTDQNPPGGWTNPSTGDENGDECAWILSGQGAMADVSMSTGSFAMQSTWSNDTNRCDISHAVFAGDDTDLALSNVPANITTEATSPSGATVTYTTPTAVDETGDTTTATVTFDHASGTTFPIGTCPGRKVCPPHLGPKEPLYVSML
jgi:serine protease